MSDLEIIELALKRLAERLAKGVGTMTEARTLSDLAAEIAHIKRVEQR
jgi:hypothetical protein